MITHLFLVCLMALGMTLQAQQAWEVGGLAGTAFYFGDVNPMFHFGQPGASLAFLARRNFDGRMCFRTTASYAHVRGSDAKSRLETIRQRNINFRTNIYEIGMDAEFNFIPFHGYNREDKNFTPFLNAGLSLFYFNPEASYQGVWYRVQPLGTEGQQPGSEYSLIQPALKIGGGFKFALSQSWSLNIDIQSRILFTDYLDDVSGAYADPRKITGMRGEIAALLADPSIEKGAPIGKNGRQRGDNSTRDYFMTVNIGLIYNFRDIMCPAY